MIKPDIVNRYEYPEYRRMDNTERGRLYCTPTGNIPSVTTILSHVKDTTEIDEWRKNVGEENANLIVNESTMIGTLMHENLEFRLEGKPDHPESKPYARLARMMADKIQENAWGDINEVWGQEVGLYYPKLWAGTTDLVGVFRGNPAIMDYKNSRKMKTEEHLDSYKLQLAAYAIAHDYLYGTTIDQGVLFICVRENPRNLVYQERVYAGDEFKQCKIEWLQAVEKYYTDFGFMD